MMKIKANKDCHVRVSSAVSMGLQAGKTYDLPAAVANALIDRGDADPVTGGKKKPATKE